MKVCSNLSHKNNKSSNMKVGSNLSRTFITRVHNNDSTVNNVRVMNNLSQSLMNTVHDHIEVHNNNKGTNIQVGSNANQNNDTCNNMKVGSKLSRTLIDIVHNNNKVHINIKVNNTCYNSFSNCSINRSSNFYFNADRALSLLNVATNHSDGRCKLLHYNIIKKPIVNIINTSTMLTCNCSSLLQKNVAFSDCKLPRDVNMHVITVPPKIWRPKPIDRFIPLPPSPDIDDDL